MEPFFQNMPSDVNFNELTGSFAVKDGIMYRETAYWEDVALFDLQDTDKKTELSRIHKDELQERFLAFAECDWQGVRYKIHKIQDGNGYFSPVTNPGKIYCKPLREINEIWIQRNYGNMRVERETVYQNPEITVLPSRHNFHLAEMHNGNLMLSYLEDLLDLKGTGEILKELYPGRIEFGKASTAALLTDEYISQIKIDGEEFDFTEDFVYELITISPKGQGGNKYIREICAYFNERKGSAVG